MINLTNLTLFVAVLFSVSCATSMSPTQVNSALPTLSKSKFISQAQAKEAIKTNTCKYLFKGRNYTAPIGFTVKSDLKYGAQGIDEWVELDGGNAYVLIGYRWVTVNDDGATQLSIEFDTMLCD